MWGDFSLREKILLLLLVLLLLGGALWKIMPVFFPPATSSQGSGLLAEENPERPETDTDIEMITVHLVGAVRNPGIYHLPAGSRVFELLEAGGGPTEEAALDSINLARPLYDGEQVAICRPGEAAANPAQAEGKININRATVEQLQSLPSIGEVRAQRIVEHREKYGPFNDIKEIMDVSGIAQGIFNQIKDRITIY